MSPFQGLIMKDYRISQGLFFTSLAVFLFFMIFGFGLSAYLKEPAGTLPIIVISALAITIFAPLMMLSILKIEGKSQLWLYSPRPSSLLFLSKFTVIFSYQLVIQFLLTIYAAISLFWFGKTAYEQIGVELFMQAIGFINLGLILFGIYFTCWITLYWTIYQTLKRSPKMKPFRFWVIIIIFFAYNVFEELMLKIKPLDEFISHYKVEVISKANLHYKGEGWSVLFEASTIPIIPFFYYVILSIILFLFAARLLGRKVEV